MFYILFLTLIIPFTVVGQKVFPQASPFDSYARGKSLVSRGNQYFILPTLEARKELHSRQKKRQPQSSQTNYDTVLAQKGGFLILAKQDGLKNPQSNDSSSDNHPVVFNPRSQQIGIVLGSLVARMKNIEQADQLVTLYGLATVEKYPSKKLAIFKGRYPGQVLEIIDRFQQDPSVSSAEVEILENLRRPM